MRLFQRLYMAMGFLGVAPCFAQDYQVGAGDTLRVEVFGEPQLSRSALVPFGCSLDVDLIGAIRICGRTTREIAEDIAAHYAAGYLVAPHVIVQVATYGSQKIEVRGAVKTPGIQVLTGPTSLSQAITAAGGPDGDNVVDVDVVSASASEKTYQLSTLNLADPPVLVSGGDTIVLRKGRHVYVDGQVKTEGPVPFHEGLTVSQAVSLAGGPNEYALLRQAYILKANGGRVVVNLVRIRNGKTPDLILLPDDRVTLRRSYF